MIRNAVQRSENKRKNSFLNYKSAALPAELCRQNADRINAQRRLKQVAYARNAGAS
jgi:hypothetical protein